MTTVSRTPTLRIAAAIITRPDGKTLLVRKRGTVAFMQAGGKIERNEAAQDALVREIGEELGLILDLPTVTYVGTVKGPAENEPGWMVEAKLFHVPLDVDVTPEAEIEEIRWVDPRMPDMIRLAMITRHFVLPALCRGFPISF